MKRVVIGIHGLGNKPSAPILETWWKQSLLEGVNRDGSSLTDIEFKLIYWADILHPLPEDPQVSDVDSPLYLQDPYIPAMKPSPPNPHNLRQKVFEFLENRISRVLLNEDLSINYQSVTDGLIKKYFQDLEAYYSDEINSVISSAEKSRDLIRARLHDVLKEHRHDDVMLIAHSMGSIVAYDVLDLYPELHVDTLVTIGSPLGLPVVIGRIEAERTHAEATGRSLPTPDTVKSSWHNLADLEDNVAFDFKIADDYQDNRFGVRPHDMQVINDYQYRRKRNPHKSYGYLRTPEMASILAKFVSVRELSWKDRFRQFFGSVFPFGKKAASPSAHDKIASDGSSQPFASPNFLPESAQQEHKPLDRESTLAQLRENEEPWDFIVIGGGATGAGVAVEAASRGYKTLLLEQHDFAKGTSSRSTKLVHGGVRYLQQGNVGLVLEALRERARMKQNAPHLVHDLPFIVPVFDWWEGPFYGIGMRVYDMLAGRHGFGPSTNLNTEETVDSIPGIETDGLRGGVRYYDGQFDDSRMVISLVRTAADEGASLLNYARVDSLIQQNGLVSGVVAVDEFSGENFTLNAKCVINATGVFTDSIRLMDDPKSDPIIKSSRGVHIVLDKSFLGGDTAIMVPHTDDGRVLFAIPWQDRVVVGTTDTPVDAFDMEPIASDEEIEFILKHAARYLTHDPQLSDIKSIFAGLRPLVMDNSSENTAKISREHQVLVSASGLISITGGKWTTYRLMAEETVNEAITVANLDHVPSQTADLAIHGWEQNAPVFGYLAQYGVDAYGIEAMITENPSLGEMLHDELPINRAMVVWAVREEMACTVEDVLARRTRCLLLDAKASIEIAEKTAKIMATELGKDKQWTKAQIVEYTAIAEKYLPASSLEDSTS
jgi:glycerol-3-phosphate dehydrogenase